MRVNIAAAISVALLFMGFAVAFAQSPPPTKEPDQARALIYVYRQTSLIGIANFDVPFLHINGRQLGRISMGGYIPITVSPGQHKVTTTESLFGGDTGKVRGQAIVTVPAGATVYLRYSETFKTFEPIVLPKGVFVNSTGNYRFEPVAASTAKSEMSGMSRLGR